MKRFGEQIHATEFSDIKPNPKAVYGPNGHIKKSFIKKFVDAQEGKLELDFKQRSEIVRHLDVDNCPECQKERRKARGDLPEGSLPFDP